MGVGGSRWRVVGLAALLVGLAGAGIVASPWAGGRGPVRGSAYGGGYGAGMMRGQRPGVMPGYGPGMMGRYGGAGSAGWGAAGAAGSGSATPGSGTAAVAMTVRLYGLRFHPAAIRVRAGTAVAFVNTDDVPHDVVNASLQDPGATPAFASPILQPGQSWTHTFATPGTFPILCSVAGHAQAGMVGTVTVTP